MPISGTMASMLVDFAYLRSIDDKGLQNIAKYHTSLADFCRSDIILLSKKKTDQRHFAFISDELRETTH